MMWYGGSDVHWWGWLIGSVMMVAFWALIIWAIWYFATSFSRQSRQSEPSRGDPKQILDERLARGEIDPDEYTRLRRLMHGGTQGADEKAPLDSVGKR